jgi:hypothetical protein
MKSLIVLSAATGLLASTVQAAEFASTPQGDLPVRSYEITITNITQGLDFTPIIVATHSQRARLFRLGEAPSDALADLAEGGATGGVEMMLEEMGDLVLDIQTSEGGLIGPGDSVTVTVDATVYHNRLSLAGMLLPTNDTFVAVDAFKLPNKRSGTLALAYDAGSEENDELCMNIPGPYCGGTPFSTGLAEGYVHISSGIHGNADLSSDAYDWRNPVAMISVRKISSAD